MTVLFIFGPLQFHSNSLSFKYLAVMLLCSCLGRRYCFPTSILSGESPHPFRHPHVMGCYLPFMDSTQLLQQMAHTDFTVFNHSLLLLLFMFAQGSGALGFSNGVPTSLRESGQQWDYPNAWPPLQHMLIEGRWSRIVCLLWGFLKTHCSVIYKNAFKDALWSWTKK